MGFDILNPTGYARPAVRVTVSTKPAYAPRKRGVDCPAAFATKGRTDGMPWSGTAPVSAGAKPDHDPLDRLAYAKGAGTVVRAPDRWRKF